jgi:hypothetical protein
MTPKGTTDDRGDQWQVFKGGKCIHIGKLSLVRYSIEPRQT